MSSSYCDLCQEEIISDDKEYVCEWCEEYYCQRCYFNLALHDISKLEEDAKIALDTVEEDMYLCEEDLCAYCGAKRDMMINLRGK